MPLQRVGNALLYLGLGVNRPSFPRDEKGFEPLECYFPKKTQHDNSVSDTESESSDEDPEELRRFGEKLAEFQKRSKVDGRHAPLAAMHQAQAVPSPKRPEPGIPAAPPTLVTGHAQAKPIPSPKRLESGIRVAPPTMVTGHAHPLTTFSTHTMAPPPAVTVNPPAARSTSGAYRSDGESLYSPQSSFQTAGIGEKNSRLAPSCLDFDSNEGDSSDESCESDVQAKRNVGATEFNGKVPVEVAELSSSYEGSEEDEKFGKSTVEVVGFSSSDSDMEESAANRVVNTLLFSNTSRFKSLDLLAKRRQQKQPRQAALSPPQSPPPAPLPASPAAGKKTGAEPVARKRGRPRKDTSLAKGKQQLKQQSKQVNPSPPQSPPPSIPASSSVAIAQTGAEPVVRKRGRPLKDTLSRSRTSAKLEDNSWFVPEDFSVAVKRARAKAEEEGGFSPRRLRSAIVISSDSEVEERRVTVTRKRQRKFKRVIGFETDSSQDDSSALRGSSRKSARMVRNSDQRDSSREDSEMAGGNSRRRRHTGEEGSSARGKVSVQPPSTQPSSSVGHGMSSCVSEDEDDDQLQSAGGESNFAQEDVKTSVDPEQYSDAGWMDNDGSTEPRPSDDGDVYSFSAEDELYNVKTPGGKKYRRLEVARPTNPTPNVRRGKRARVPPVNPLLGEKVEYDWRRRSGTTLTGILVPKQPANTQAERKKAVVDDSAFPFLQYVHPVSQQETTKQIVYATASCNKVDGFGQEAEDESPIIINKLFSFDDQASAGTIVFKPLAEKVYCLTSQHDMLFVVTKGRLLFRVQNEEYEVGASQGAVHVPQGVYYSIRNTKRSVAELTFMTKQT